ncbi:MAG: indole-3-glycerol phosphate synthase TrpC [Bacteroidales bacterium]
MSILDDIIHYKRQEVKEKKQITPVEVLCNSSLFQRIPFSLAESIEGKKGKAVIAEYKRKSPSKGIINDLSDVVQTTVGYMHAGVAGISILTDEKFFGGSPKDLINVRAQIRIPILRKDFIVDPYQVYEAKAMGADVILLIAACLTATEMLELSQLATSLRLETLFEIHDIDEIDKLPKEARLVGVNNRNLKNFEVDLNHSKQICNSLPRNCLKIAESGIHSVEDANILSSAGFDAFLIGEYFMKQESPETACRNFLEALNKAL